MGKYITFGELLIWIPIIGGLCCFILKGKKNAFNWAFIISLITLFVAIAAIYYMGDAKAEMPQTDNWYKTAWIWMKELGSSFAINMQDGLARAMCLLTAITFPIIVLATRHNNYKNEASFYGLLLLAIGGIMGVFVAHDALAFYFFWELALIPVYFLASMWGGEKRIQASFKFFIYTFTGSLLLLIGIIYIYSKTPVNANGIHNFAWSSFINVSEKLTAGEQNGLFWLFFIAFAIKMPIFPFHTWQPTAYEQSPTPVTMIMSGLMVKMGLFAVVKWLLPVLPLGVNYNSKIVIVLCLIGIIYASIIAIKQDNIKQLVAYSSIAHIGLMCLALFVQNNIGYKGALLQMFNHGINVIALWYVVNLLEKYTGTTKLSEMGGLAKKLPILTLFLVIFAFANVAAPLTNAFIGEFMMFNGIFKYNVWFAFIAGLSIILSAVYTLTMVQKIFYGSENKNVNSIKDIDWIDIGALSILLVAIIMMGIYPQPMINLLETGYNYITELKP